MEETPSFVTRSCAFSGKLLLSRKLGYFRGSSFSQCFVLSTAPHCSYQVIFNAFVLSITNIEIKNVKRMFG